jgi:hypothetical protein
VTFVEHCGPRVTATAGRVGYNITLHKGGTTMRWVRANLRFGAWCALLALAMQFALSFGHVHLPGTNKGTSALLVQLLAPSTTAPGDPAKPLKQIAHDQCAVCASIQLAASVPPAAAPSIELPADPSPAWLAVNTDPALAASPHDSFRARAPPQA